MGLVALHPAHPPTRCPLPADKLVCQQYPDLSLGDYSLLWKAHKKLSRSALLLGTRNIMEPVVQQLAQEFCEVRLHPRGPARLSPQHPWPYPGPSSSGSFYSAWEPRLVPPWTSTTSSPCSPAASSAASPLEARSGRPSPPLPGPSRCGAESTAPTQQEDNLIRSIYSCVQDLMTAWDHWSVQILELLPFLRVRCSLGSSGPQGGWLEERIVPSS